MSGCLYWRNKLHNYPVTITTTITVVVAATNTQVCKKPQSLTIKQPPVSQGSVARVYNLAESLVLRYDTRCYFNVRSKADISQLNLPHGTDN